MEKVWAITNTRNTDDMALFRKVITAVRGQVAGIIVTDNDSRPEIKTELRELETEFAGFATFIWNPQDLGLGASLNRGARAAMERGAEWILTLDDDSVVADGMVETLLTAYRALSPEDQNRVSLLMPNEKTPRKLAYPEGPAVVIEASGTTAGQIVKAAILPKIGFWDEGLFIDHVDGEFCFRVGRSGFSTLLAPNTTIFTRPGHPVLKKFLGKTISIPNYRPYRYYYMCRNFTYMNVRNWRTYLWGNPHWRNIISTIIFPRYFIKMLMFEKNRGEKLRASLHGYWDGLRGRTGPMPK